MMGLRNTEKKSIWKVTPLKIVTIYAVIGGLWILFSDRLLAALVKNPSLVTQISILKGWVYVAATAWMLYGLIKRNVSAIQRSQEITRQSEERLAGIIQTTPSGIMIIDRSGKINFANPAAARIFGLPETAIVERTYNDALWKITTADGEPIVDSELPAEQVFSTGKSAFGIELSIERPDGKRIIILTNSAPLRDSSGNIVAVVLSFSDITESKEEDQRKLELEKNKREFYRRTILAATEGKLNIVDYDEIECIAGHALATWEIQKGEDLSEIREFVARIAESVGMESSRLYDFILCVGESTTNAYKHVGSGTASLHRNDGDLIFVVSDKGQGMETLTLPDVALKMGFSTAKSLGMGYKAIISIADKVYLATGPAGTTVAIQMSIHPVKKVLTPALLPDTWS